MGTFPVESLSAKLLFGQVTLVGLDPQTAPRGQRTRLQSAGAADVVGLFVNFQETMIVRCSDPGVVLSFGSGCMFSSHTSF